jgi:DNA-binding protein HU-beta
VSIGRVDPAPRSGVRVDHATDMSSRRDIHHSLRRLGYRFLAGFTGTHVHVATRRASPPDEPHHTTLGGSVNKSHLIDAIAEGSGLSKSQAEGALNAMLDAVQSAVAKGDKVTLPGFGAWSQSQRSARQGRNPRSGEIVQIAASKGVKFSAGAKFKAAVK